MRLFHFVKTQKNPILSLILGGFLLFGLLAPTFTKAAILVTGGSYGYVNEEQNDNWGIIVTGAGVVSTTTTKPYSSSSVSETSHPLCHSNICYVSTTTTTTHPLCHTTYNCNTSTWQCVVAPCGTGQYTSLATCQANCIPPTTTTTKPPTYNCNTSTWQCVKAPCGTGQYASLANCQANCLPPVKYSCNTNTWQCYQDPYGPYTSLSTCQTNCQAPITRYSCNISTWQCIIDSSGPYTSLSSCQANCQPPITRYSCNTNTWQCYQDNYGPYTSFNSCQSACQPSTSSLYASCYASPSSAQINQTITFYSNVSGGSGNYSYYWSGVASGYQSYSQRSFSSPGTQTAYLTVYDSQGRSASTSCNVYISGSQCPNPPTINLWADKYSVSQGETTYLRWSSNNANYCVASNGWSGNKPTNGIEAITPYANTTYTLTCYGYSDCGSVSQSVTIYTAATGTNLSLTKLGRNLSAGSRVYSKVIQVLQNDIIEFHLTVSAGSNTDLHNVVVKDLLPSVLTYMSGTTKVDGITQPDTITTTGLSLGTIYRGTSKIITFQAGSGYSSVYLSHTNTAEAIADNQSKVTDSATVTYGLVAGAATVKTGVGNSLLISFVISLILAFAVWYYFRFNPNGQMALAGVERKTRDARLAYSRYRFSKQNKK